MRQVILDNYIKDRLSRAIVGPGFEAGLLFGRQVTDGPKDLVVYCTSVGQDPEGSVPAPTSLDKVDREWVATQVLQAGRMLVGGMAVLGVYAVSKEAGRRAVEALQRLWPTDVKEPDSLVFLHLSSDSSQFTARAGPSRGDLNSVDLKFQPLVGKFVCYHSMVDVALQLELPEAKDAAAREDAFFRALLKAVKAQGVSLDASPAIVAGSGDLGAVPARLVELYTAFEAPTIQEEVKQQEAYEQKWPLRTVRLAGAISAVAFVHEKESADDGVKALKADVVRSLRSRLTILRDESLNEQEDNTGLEFLCGAIHQGGVVHLPRRVLLPLEPPGILLCDYLLPAEEASEALVRFEEAFGLASPSEADLIMPEAEAEGSSSSAVAQEVEVAGGDSSTSVPRDVVERQSGRAVAPMPKAESAGPQALFLTVGMLVVGLLLVIAAVALRARV